MKMGVGLASDSVEVRRQRRLPLKQKFTFLPNRGLIGGATILLLLLPVFLMVTQHELSKGIYVRLAPRPHTGPDEICMLGPILVTVRQHGSAIELFLAGKKVSQERLQAALKSELAPRVDWEVLVEGDASVPFADLMYAVEAINSLHAKPVILTPRSKEQIAKRCSSR